NGLLYRLARRLTGRRLSRGTAKLAAAGLAALVALAIVAGVVLFLVGLIRGHAGDIPTLFQKMAEILDETRLWLGEWAGTSFIPDAASDAESLKGAIAEWLRTHAAELRTTGGELGRSLLHIAVGMAIGLLVFFRTPAETRGPLARALGERLARLEAAFEIVVFAQVKISAVNTALTAIYLLVALPLFGVHLPLAGTLVAVTF